MLEDNKAEAVASRISVRPKKPRRSGSFLPSDVISFALGDKI
jgi:hypothetical protein